MQQFIVGNDFKTATKMSKHITDVTKTFYIFILHCTSKMKVLEVLRGGQLTHNSFYFAVLLQRSLPMKFDSEI